MLISGAFPTDFAHSACVFRTVDSDSRRSPARRRMQRKNVMPKSKIRLRGSVFGLRFAKAFRGSPGGGAVLRLGISDRLVRSALGFGTGYRAAYALRTVFVGIPGSAPQRLFAACRHGNAEMRPESIFNAEP